MHRLRITDPGGPTGKYGIWILGRLHAWEASGSWVTDQLVRWLVSADPQAVRLRRKAVVNAAAEGDDSEGYMANEFDQKTLSSKKSRFGKKRAGEKMFRTKEFAGSDDYISEDYHFLKRQNYHAGDARASHILLTFRRMIPF